VIPLELEYLDEDNVHYITNATVEVKIRGESVGVAMEVALALLSLLFLIFLLKFRRRKS